MMYTFPADFMYWQTVDTDKKYNNLLRSYVDQDRDQMDNPWSLCNALSTFGISELNQKLYDDDLLNEIVWRPFDRMLKKSGGDIPRRSIIDAIWLNYYPSGSFQEVHNHSSTGTRTIDGNDYYALYSIVHIVKEDPDDRCLCFRKTTPSAGNYPLRALAASTKHLDQYGEGTTIIFPSHLDHYVLPCTHSRITLSANVFSMF